MIELPCLAPGLVADLIAQLPPLGNAMRSLSSSRLWLSADVRRPATQLHMLRFLERDASALPACDHARLGALTVAGEHGAALRLRARRVAPFVGGVAVPDASATALVLATSVLGGDRAAFELAVRAGSRAARVGRGRDPVGCRSQRPLLGAAGWALGQAIQQDALDWHDALERFDHLREGNPLTRTDKEIRR